MQIDEQEAGLDRFINACARYYENKGYSGNLRDRALAQWLDLKSFKEKVRLLEYLEKENRIYDMSQPKITKYFKPIGKSSVKKEQSEVAQGPQTAKKERKESIDEYKRFADNTYWKIKLEYENLSPESIKQMVHKQWSAKKQLFNQTQEP
ncbi:hypothetical protein pb186bvf_009913 [Paramecium bursaria]